LRPKERLLKEGRMREVKELVLPPLSCGAHELLFFCDLRPDEDAKLKLMASLDLWFRWSSCPPMALAKDSGEQLYDLAAQEVRNTVEKMRQEPSYREELSQQVYRRLKSGGWPAELAAWLAA
jgi:carbonic anhydrase